MFSNDSDVCGWLWKWGYVATNAFVKNGTNAVINRVNPGKKVPLGKLEPANCDYVHAFCSGNLN